MTIAELEQERARRNRADIKTSTMSRPKDKEEAIAFEAIMRAINELVPTTDYMRAENACTVSDAAERKEYGESSGLLPDLRHVKDNMLADARSLAESIASLQREVAYATEGTIIKKAI